MSKGNSFGCHSRSLTIPGTGGQYSSEEIHTVADNPSEAGKGRGEYDTVNELTLYVGTLPSSAEIVVDLLAPDGDPQVAADWREDVITISAAGLATFREFAAVKGIRVRGLSGGTGGSVDVDVWWA